MQETLNFTDTFVDEDGNRFDLGSDIYQPTKFSVNALVLKGISAAVIAGRSPQEF